VTPGANAEGLQEISERDATIVRLMAAGVADASIARQTGISQRTVERRVRFVMDRLGARTRFQAAVQATRRGWI
jgi:DNA-binding NarL/FixJ family response regulator